MAKEEWQALAHVDAGDPMLHASYVNENEPIDPMWTDEANTGRTLRLESGSPKSRNFYAPDSFSPMISAFHDRNLEGAAQLPRRANLKMDFHSPDFQ